MKKRLYFIFLSLMVGCSLVAQTKTIQINADTSGYSNSNKAGQPTTVNGNEVVPTIKGEMNVNGQGSLTYNIPIEVPKGVNSFQPNLALAYSSDGGNGQAGYGWNLVGLSSITVGGKSKRVDGVYEGVQPEGGNPLYLDGQRLIETSNNTYSTEKYSSIIVKRIQSNGGHPTLMVQYPDGKVAKYENLFFTTNSDDEPRYIANGSYLITSIQDAYGNTIEYNYTVDKLTPYVDTIKYGKTTGSHPFTISFIRGDRHQPVRVWRNGKEYVNTKVIKEIQVSTAQEGIFRKYLLTHDITSLKQERLIEVNVENGDGEPLKPLLFNYNTSTGQLLTIDKSNRNRGFVDDVTSLGSVTMGDFFGDGDISAIYVQKRKNKGNVLTSSKNGTIYTGGSNYNPDLKVGKIILSDGKFSARDQLLEIKSELIENTQVNGFNFKRGKIKFEFKDLVTNELNSTFFYANFGFTMKPDACSVYAEQGDDAPMFNIATLEDMIDVLTGDFNNDGLLDVLLTIKEQKGLSKGYGISLCDVPLNSHDQYFLGGNIASKSYFIEIGRIVSQGGAIDLTDKHLSTDLILGSGDVEHHIIEYDGDGIPEIMQLNTNTKKFDVLKFDFLNKRLKKLPVWGPDFFKLRDYTKGKTPLVFGDFNGDGLTDFMTPKKVYDLETQSAQTVIKSIETDQHYWWQYINRGEGFAKSLRNFTEQKLAHCAPSQRNIIKKSSFWDKLWSGKPDMYTHTQYASCAVIPVDYNNDGRTDLATFKKFGTVKYKEKLKDAEVYNYNTTIGTGEYYPHSHDRTCYEEDHYGEPIGPPICGLPTGEIKVQPEQVNKIIFHENVYDSGTTGNFINEFSFNTHPETEESLANTKISPFSLLINSQQSNGLESYSTKLVLHDPHQSNDVVIELNTNGFLENHLKEVDNSSGVIQHVDYTPLQRYIKDGPRKKLNLFYKYKPEELDEPYPYYVHKQVPLKLLVSRVSTLFDGKSITKEYRYENAVQHLDGQGFLGFQKTYSSDAYESRLTNDEYLPKNMSDAIFWTINTHDPTIENQLVKTTYGGLGNEFFTESTLEHQKFEKPNKRYLYLNIKEVSKDYLKNVTITKTNQYNYSNLLLNKTTTQHDQVGTSISWFEYQPQWTNGDHFYHGRIKKVTKGIHAYGDYFTTKDVYSNFNQAGIPRTHDKYGHNTNALTTTTSYDSYGNKLSETIATNGAASLTTSYEYDNTKRFVTSVTDPEGLTATSKVNIHGWVEEETSALGLTTTHTFDDWGNPLTSTNYLGITTTLVKQQLSNGKYSLSTTTPGTPKTIAIFDRFDRQVQTKTQSINNKWVIVDTEYDIFGKKIKQSEPYFQGESATLWNSTAYDELDRPISQIMYNGKEVITCYEGLTVTVEDGEQKHTKTMDAMGNVIYHKDQGGAITYKYYANGTLKEANYEGIKITVEQDGWGNKTKLNDPSAGIYTYEYDAFGRKLKEISPKGQTTYVYDDFGKLLVETTVGDHTNISTQYEYDPDTKLPIRIIGNNGEETFTYETYYDDYYRIKGKKEIHPQFTYETLTTFDDQFGRPDVTQTKTTLSTLGEEVKTEVKNMYDNTGFLVVLANNLTGDLLWYVNGVNAKGQTTSSHYGNNYQITNTYNEYYLPKRIEHRNLLQSLSNGDGVAINMGYTFNNQEGLLLKRVNSVFNKSEEFEFDDLKRLIQETVNGTVKNQYTYDKRGRITHNTAIGNYKYPSNNYQLEQLALNAKGKQLKEERGFHNITYNSFKKAVNIHLQNKERIDFVYNLFKDRTAMYYGSEAEDKLARPLRKYYSSDKAVEIKHNTQTNTWEVFTYLDGDPYSASVVQKNTFTNNTANESELYYLHRDYQATILAISNESGQIIEKREFDAWGNLREAWNRTDGNTHALVFLDRGYTGHEHLQGVGLVHMNGRLYDPELRRFLSPDNFVQDPYNTQNFNRYTYVLNNPLMYTDPSGEIIVPIIIGAAIAITMNAINNIVNGNPWWYGAGKSAVVGAISGAISFGVGQAATGIFGDALTVGKALFQAGAHGTTGGLMNVIDGGSFASGFASGAVSSLISSGIESLGNIKVTKDYSFDVLNESTGKLAKSSFQVTAPLSVMKKDLYKVIQIASGGLSGGISSSIAGGNFWDGARQGLITSGLNHLAHYTSKGEKYTFEKGKSPFRIQEITYLAAGVGISGSYGELRIFMELGGRGPKGLEGQKISARGPSINFGVNPPKTVEVFTATAGDIILDKNISGNSLLDLFKETNFVTVQSIGALFKFSRIDAYTDRNMNTKVFHSNAFGGGINAGYGGDRYTTDWENMK